MAPAPTVPSNMKHAEARHDVVARSGSGDIGAVRELAHGLHQGMAIDRSLSRPEILSCPPDDVCEIDFSDRS